MRLIIAFAPLGLSLLLGGCSGASYVAVIFREPPKPADVTEVKLQPSPIPKAPTQLAAATLAQEAPMDIVASQIRGQGYACESPQSAKRDVSASKAHEVLWILSCQNATYRVTLVPSMAAKVEKVAGASPISSTL